MIGNFFLKSSHSHYRKLIVSASVIMDVPKSKCRFGNCENHQLLIKNKIKSKVTLSHFCCTNVSNVIFGGKRGKGNKDPSGKEGKRKKNAVLLSHIHRGAMNWIYSAFILRYFLRQTKTKCKICLRQFFSFFCLFLFFFKLCCTVAPLF